MLYIVPLQEEFDLAPLSYDAQEFSLMPKAECKICCKVMSLQLLALHVKQCNAPECDTLSDPELKIRVLAACELLVKRMTSNLIKM